jgi:putative membrane protein
MSDQRFEVSRTIEGCHVLPSAVDPADVPVAHGAGSETGEDTGRRPDGSDEVGSDPDPRLTFANERTYLAWNRTALALIAGGLAVAQFVKVGVAGAQLIVALPLIALGAFMSYSSYHHWQSNEQALRLAESLPASALPRILAYAVGAFAVGATALALVHFAS